jgi:cytochrome c peroxidase
VKADQRFMGPARIAALVFTATLAAIALVPFATTAQEEEANPFQPFKVQTGTVLTIKGPNCFNFPGIADVCSLDIPELGHEANPFFSEDFGTNGQDCTSCHQPQLGWGTTPQFLQDQFSSTQPQGLAPQFRINDAAINPTVSESDLSTEQARRVAYALSLDLGLARLAIRVVGTPTDDFTVTAADVPSNAQFGPLPVPAGQDPQQPCSVQAPAPCVPTVSAFRRPLVTTNMFFDSSVLWDGRQNVIAQPLLRAQVKGAARTLILNREDPNSAAFNAEADQVAHLMTGIFTAMITDNKAGDLCAPGVPCQLGIVSPTPGALGGPTNLSLQKPCTPLVTGTCDATPGFTLFNAWNNLGGTTDPCAPSPAGVAANVAARLAVACGQKLFKTVDLHSAAFTPVTGSAVGHCDTCHTAANVGDNTSAAFFVNIGLASPPEFFVGGPTAAGNGTTMNLPKFHDRTARLPLYQLQSTAFTPNGQCSNVPFVLINGCVRLTDPGRALISHHLVTNGNLDAGAFKPPILHDLAPRAPFFHNGAAETLDDVVDFYNQLFDIRLTQRQHDALVAFLQVL